MGESKRAVRCICGSDADDVLYNEEALAVECVWCGLRGSSSAVPLRAIANWDKMQLALQSHDELVGALDGLFLAYKDPQMVVGPAWARAKDALKLVR